MSRYLNEALVWSALKRIPHIDRQAVLQALKGVPSADAEEVRHGNWIDVLEYSVYIPDMKTSIVLTEQKCSNCGVVTTFKGDKMYLPDFCCPNCGAKMDGADGE